MNTAELFKTPVIAEQVRILLAEHKKLSYSQIYQLLKYDDRRSKKNVLKAISKMRDKGLVTVTDHTVEYQGGGIGKKKADMIWDAMRLKKVFTVPELMKLTEASRSYIKNSIMKYRREGILLQDGWALPPGSETGKKIPVYRLVKDTRCRPR